MSRQKELDADSKAIQQIQFVGQLKNRDGINADETQNVFILTKHKKVRLKFSAGSVTVLQKMANYQEARVKLTNTQLSKLKSASKNKTGTILRINKKNFEDEELSHALFLTARQMIKIRNAFAKNMSTDIELSKAQLSKITQSDGFLRNMLGNLGKK